MFRRALLTAATFLMFSTSPIPAATVDCASWGKTKSGEEVHLFTLRAANGMEARITNWGGIIVSLTVPDRKGQMADVVLGFDSLEPYLGKHPFFGCITGRYANRIGNATFSIDGQTYHVTANSGRNHIHGGKEGFDKKLWKAKPFVHEDGAGVELTYRSADGEEGYPGNLNCTVTYKLSDEGGLTIDYTATTDRPTIVNLTNHCYFNLAGEGSGDVLGHELMIAADQYTLTEDDLVSTGELSRLAGPPLDFSTPHRIGDRIGDNHPALVQGLGYDHNYVLKGTGMKLAARAKDTASGRVMEVHTTQPGVQLYTGNHLKDVRGKKGHIYPKRGGFCLETQHYPDSPNHPEFPSVVLRPGETYRQTTIFKFLTE